MNLVKEMFFRIALAIFYICSVLFHKKVNEFIDIFYKKYSFEATNRFFIYTLILPLVIGIIFFLYTALRRDRKNFFVAMGIILLPVAIYYFLFFVSNVEAVHYFQYAIVSFLIYKISHSIFYSFITSTILGIIDEGYQFYVLYAGRSGVYLDYNDMLFNIHGTMIGIVFYMMFSDSNYTFRREIEIKNNPEKEFVATTIYT